jgi:hypothetical protein
MKRKWSKTQGITYLRSAGIYRMETNKRNKLVSWGRVVAAQK